jgi:hypothetical protein
LSTGPTNKTKNYTPIWRVFILYLGTLVVAVTCFGIALYGVGFLILLAVGGWDLVVAAINGEEQKGGYLWIGLSSICIAAPAFGFGVRLWIKVARKTRLVSDEKLEEFLNFQGFK